MSYYKHPQRLLLVLVFGLFFCSNAGLAQTPNDTDQPDEDEQPGAVQFPMLHCPFCGTSLQTVEQIDAKGAGFSS